MKKVRKRFAENIERLMQKRLGFYKERKKSIKTNVVNFTIFFFDRIKKKLSNPIQNFRKRPFQSTKCVRFSINRYCDVSHVKLFVRFCRRSGRLSSNCQFFFFDAERTCGSITHCVRRSVGRWQTITRPLSNRLPENNWSTWKMFGRWEGSRTIYRTTSYPFVVETSGGHAATTTTGKMLTTPGRRF